jgi:hypothetical protein
MTASSPSRLSEMDSLPAEVLRGIVSGAQVDDRPNVDSDMGISLMVGPDVTGATATGSGTTGLALQSCPASVNAETGSHGGGQDLDLL